MEYSFDIEVAKKYGVDEAIMIKNLQMFAQNNKSENKNFDEVITLTYNSAKSLAQLFPFWSEKQINRIIKSIQGKYKK